MPCETACVDLESYVKGGPTLTTFFFRFFLVHEGRGIQIPL